MDKINIGITGTGSLIGQAVIKSIRASSLNEIISMFGFDYFKDTVGSYWVKKNFVLPDILKVNIKEEAWLNELIKSLRSEEIKFLFIGLDFELPLFAKYKDLIESESKCKVIVSNSEVIKIAEDKYLTYKFLKENGFYYPKTWLPEECNIEEISFPCIVKPRKGNRSRDVSIVNNQEELNTILPRINDPIIQELIGDMNQEYTCGVICFDGEVKKSIVLGRNLKNGNTETAYYKSGTPIKIYDYIHRIADKLKPFGACNMQLRLDENDGLPKLFEINARHSGTTYIRSLFGFKEVEYILNHLLGLDCGEFILKEGVVKRYNDEMFISLLEV